MTFQQSLSSTVSFIDLPKTGKIKTCVGLRILFSSWFYNSSRWFSNWVPGLLVARFLPREYLGVARMFYPLKMAALHGVFAAFLVLCAQRTSAFYYGQFPDNFAWGVSTSAYQTEGSWNDKGTGNWDGMNYITENNLDKAYNYIEAVQIL